MKSLVIWGAGQHARTVADVALTMQDFQIAGFLDDINPERYGTAFCGSTILGGGDQLPTLRAKGVSSVFVALGDNDRRLEYCQRVIHSDLELATLVHSDASIAADCSLGSGTIVRAGAVIEADNSLGMGVIVGANCALGHGCRVEDGVRISLGSTLTGGVRLKEKSRIGPGCTVMNDITVGEGALLGAGAVLLRDLPPYKVAVGCPAKVVRDVTEEDL